MNTLISKFRPISDASYILEASKGRISKELITRRAAGIKDEIEILFKNSTVSPEEVAQIAKANIHAFVDTAITSNNLLNKDVQNLQEELSRFVEDRAQKASAKALDSEVEASIQAFDLFLNTSNLISKTEQVLGQTENAWKAKADELEKESGSRTHVIHTIAKADLALPSPELVRIGHLEQQKASLVTRLQAISSRLKNAPTSGQSLEEMIPAGLDKKAFQKLKNRAQKADALLAQAVTVRNQAHKLMAANIAAISFLQDEKTAGQLLDELSTNLVFLSHAMNEYDPKEKQAPALLIDKNRGLIENYQIQINNRHKLDRDDLQKLGIADFSATGAGNFRMFMEFKRKHFESAVERFERFQKIENLFVEGHISELSVLDFQSVTPKLFDRLREIVLEKLSPLSTEGASPDSIAGARKYKQDLRQFLKNAGEEIGQQFSLENLKRTWGEWFSELLVTFLNFLRSLVSSSEVPREEQPLIHQPSQEILPSESSVSERVAEVVVENPIPAAELSVSDFDLDAESVANPGEATQAYLERLEEEESDLESVPGFSAAAAYEQIVQQAAI